MKDAKQRTIEYKGYHIVQLVEWKDNPIDGAGYEVRTTIKELPKYSGFAQLVWLNKDKQKAKVMDEADKAGYVINQDIKAKEPTIFDELGFENVKDDIVRLGIKNV